MQRPITLTIAVAVLIAGVLLAGAWYILRPGGAPLVEASFSEAVLTPNADGAGDTLSIHYVLRRQATISIALVDSAGTRYYFRQDKPRDAGAYDITFGGVVSPYLLPGEILSGTVLARVLQNGAYTWEITARDTLGAQNTLSGPLTIAEADTALPALSAFTISPPAFSPNQDGIDDRVTINVWLDKTIAEGGLRVYLLDPTGAELAPISEQVSDIPAGQRGLHAFDYDGGIDQGFEPPANGTYTVRAVAQDRLGQQMQVESQLTIFDGGLPRAEISLGQVDFSATTLVKGQVLTFRLVVENYGTAPLRTTGPFSGWVYDSMNTNANALGDYEQSGAWRIGLHCESCETDYPWRWALGTAENLTLIPDSKGHPQYYLMPGQKVVVTGGLVLDRVIPSLNPQYFWVGLIHERVEVVNNRVDQELITIVEP
ncbi:MAG: hypothetical protein ABI847_18395 [Anaerolineales bacterium]